MSTPLDLAPIEQMLATATPGPWGWFGNTGCQQIYLATQRMGRRFVMGFRRWGMSGAQPMFQSENLLWTIPELAERGEVVVKPYGVSEIVGVNHPDMVLIERAPETIRALLDEVKRLRGLVGEERSA